jgi:hypothetical protein
MARAADHGVFAPTLVVSRRTWPSRPRVIALTRDTFATEAEATDWIAQDKRLWNAADPFRTSASRKRRGF